MGLVLAGRTFATEWHQTVLQLGVGAHLHFGYCAWWTLLWNDYAKSVPSILSITNGELTYTFRRESTAQFPGRMMFSATIALAASSLVVVIAERTQLTDIQGRIMI